MPPGSSRAVPVSPQTTRSTQRIVLPASAPGGSKFNSTIPISKPGTAPSGRINLPIGMILRCLPPEVLASDLSEFEASGAAATEIGIPMNMILGQLPSGKVEMPLQELVPHFPPGYLQPTESIASYLPNLINLPLMDVVMRIPPDLLALRPDQKDVDSSVINMADPFTEEILREQAEAARRQQAAQTNIIDESQVPSTEEFVPQAAPKTVAPSPRQTSSLPMPTPRAASPSQSAGAPPMPQAPKLPSPPNFSRTGPVQAAGSVRAPVPPAAPNATSRTISPSGRLPVTTRATAPIPTRPTATAVTAPIQMPPTLPSTPPAARQTSSLPAPSGFRPPSIAPSAFAPTQPVSPSLPKPQGGSTYAATQPVFPTAKPVPPPTPPVAATPPPPVAPEPPPTPEPEPAPAEDSGDLQRLAALAMAELGENDEPGAPAATEPEPEPAPVEETPSETVKIPNMPATAAAPAPTPAPAPVEPEPAPAPQPAAEATGNVAFNLNTCNAGELVKNIPGCSSDLAQSIVDHRTKIGSFKRLEDLLDVPGMTKAAYTNLTGEAPPENRIPLSLNELLGFPQDQHLSLKDVTDRISCWPDVTGCLLSQSSGLSLVGNVPEGLEKSAIVAFAPRMFDAVNKSFFEITGRETDDLAIPSPGTSFHMFRNKHLYLIILSRLPQIPERHMKVARFVLAALSIRRD